MEALLNPIIKAFGWSMFHSLWQGAIIYGLLFLVLISKSALSARLKHNLAFSAICMMFFSFLVTFSAILKLPSDQLFISLPQKLQPVIQGSATTIPITFNNLVEPYLPYLVALYVMGLIIQIVLIIVSYQKLQILKNAMHHAVPLDWNQRFEDIIKQLKINKPVGFYLSDHVNVPLVIGFFKPVILIPIGLATQLDLQQVEAILIHELSHIRRNDYLLNLVKTGIETILFFNPFVWLSSRFIHLERENDCDDRVLKLTGTPLTYAHALLKIEILKNKQKPALSLAAIGNSQHLYQRIKRITDMKTTYMNAKQRLFAITLTLGTIVSLAWVSPVKEKAELKTAATTMFQKMELLSNNQKLKAEHSFLKKQALYLPIDSPEKKKKIKIITVDENGKQTTYQSIAELPDSLKMDLNESIYFNGKPFSVLDSGEMNTLIGNAQLFAEKFNTPGQQAKLEKLSLRMQKDAERIAERYNSPQEQAKWEKLGKKMELQIGPMMEKFNSPAYQAKLKGLTDSMTRVSILVNKRLNTPEFKDQMKRLNNNLDFKAKSLRMTEPEPGAVEVPIIVEPLEMNMDFNYGLENKESKSLKNSEAYKKLKKDFDTKVEKLKKKQEKQ